MEKICNACGVLFSVKDQDTFCVKCWAIKLSAISDLNYVAPVFYNMEAAKEIPEREHDSLPIYEPYAEGTLTGLEELLIERQEDTELMNAVFAWCNQVLKPFSEGDHFDPYSFLYSLKNTAELYAHGKKIL